MTIINISYKHVSALGKVLSEDFPGGDTAVEEREDGSLWVYSLEQSPPKYIIRITNDSEIEYPEGHPKHTEPIPF